MTITVIGLDLAKNVFQVHGIDENGRAVLRRKIRRSEVLPLFSKLPPARVGMEACHTSHYWAREIARFGRDVRMTPAQFVKPICTNQVRESAGRTDGIVGLWTASQIASASVASFFWLFTDLTHACRNLPELFSENPEHLRSKSGQPVVTFGS